MNGAGLFFLLLLFLVILPILCWLVYTRWRAHSRGLPAPPLSAYNPFKRSSQPDYSISPRPSNPLHWVQDKIAGFRSSRSGGGSYSTANHGNSRRGFGPLDPDGAWDDRVGAEADAYGPAGGEYEEQELGLHPPPPGHYGGSGYGQQNALPGYGEEQERGRSRSRDETAYVGGGQRGLDQRYDEEMHGGVEAVAGSRVDPFGDEAERSDLRGVSPRPVVEASHGKKTSLESGGSRKSMFHEAM